MSRKRPGDGRTWIMKPNGSDVCVIFKASGEWITTGEAKGWPRCTRCRTPTENWASSNFPGLCERCLWAVHKLTPDQDLIRWTWGQREQAKRELIEKWVRRRWKSRDKNAALAQ